MDAEGLPPEFVELLRAERARVLPCVGAGLSIPAGIADLATDLVEAASARSIELEPGDLASVVEALESRCGVAETQQLVAETIRAAPVKPTQTHKALALCPSRIVATFNYDDCLELAAEAVGRIPRPLLPNTALAFRHPEPNELVVLHLHGAATDSSSIVLPGRTTERLATNELFMRILTAVWAEYIVVYFGFSFAPTEVHLFDALSWLARELPDADEQRLLLREFEVEQRALELATLRHNPLFEVVPYPDTPDHRAVHQAALLLGPTNEPAPDNVTALAHSPVPHYEPAALLEVEPGADPAAIQAEAFRADWCQRSREFPSFDHGNSPALGDREPPLNRGELGRARSDSLLFPPLLRSSFACVRDEELMRLTNRHASVAPVIEERPGRYLAYFENKFGEQLVFVHDDGESDATVLLGDVGWEPCRVSDAGGLADVGELILNDEERAFVNACWIATAWRREDARPAARWHGRHDLPEAPAGC